MAEKKATKTTKNTKATKSTKTEAKSASPQKNLAGQIICGVIAAIAIIAAVIGITYWVDTMNKNSRAGHYDLSAIKTNDEDQTDSIELLKALGLAAEIELYEDKTCKFDLFGQEQDGDCTYTNTEFKIGDTTTPYTFENNTITFEKDGNTLSFTRAQEQK